MSPLSQDQRKLVEAHVALVRKLSRLLARRLGVPVSDLEGVGNEALVRCAQRFDPARGVPFEGYAYLRIRGAMFDACDAANGGTLAALRRVGDADAREQVDVEPDAPSIDELLAESADSTHRRVMESLRDRIASLAAHLSVQAEASAEQTWIEQAEHQRSIRAIHSVVESLGEPERSVVRGLYWDAKTLDQIAGELGVAKKTAWRSHLRAKEKLREALVGAGVGSASGLEAATR